ncbi:MAG: hypothetical protein B6226_02050 [Candidatus Cloacimonetes bacterium 4572_65]|nr:MAG: hypothetical protein B6226_02050 [Candidatus Cloacimonetes bacterium 4572_65]
MATTKKSSGKKSTAKKKAPAKKKSTAKKGSKKKANKQNSGKKLSISTLVIIIIAVSGFFYLNKKDVKSVAPKVETVESFDLNSGDIFEAVAKQTAKQTNNNDTNLNLDTYELAHYYPTVTPKNGKLVEHKAYSVDYNESHEQADWVFYELTKKEVKSKIIKRKDKFKRDPSSSISSATPADYKKSGYDRGHLCPAAANRWSQVAMDESFYMSNMSPQKAELNRYIWKDLESQVRDWAVDFGKVYVATGPILKDGFSHKIGKNQVSVPKYYYKVVADLSGPEIKGVGFIFVNGQNNGELKHYSCTIDAVEERTGLDFFSKLPDSVEREIESDFELEEWFNNEK